MKGLPEVCQDLLKSWSHILNYLSTTAPEYPMQEVRNRVGLLSFLLRFSSIAIVEFLMVLF